jgi:hypothetical protein
MRRFCCSPREGLHRRPLTAGLFNNDRAFPLRNRHFSPIRVHPRPKHRKMAGNSRGFPQATCGIVPSPSSSIRRRSALFNAPFSPHSPLQERLVQGDPTGQISPPPQTVFVPEKALHQSPSMAISSRKQGSSSLAPERKLYRTGTEMCRVLRQCLLRFETQAAQGRDRVCQSATVCPRWGRFRVTKVILGKAR